MHDRPGRYVDPAPGPLVDTVAGGGGAWRTKTRLPLHSRPRGPENQAQLTYDKRVSSRNSLKLRRKRQSTADSGPGGIRFDRFPRRMSVAAIDSRYG